MQIDGVLSLEIKMKEIQLTQGKTALVSDDRFQELSQWKWQTKFSNGMYYATRRCNKENGGQWISMHRQITGASEGIEVDHIDGNGLNNQDQNLRLCNRSQNNMNKNRYKNNTSGYKGVSPCRNKWRACLYFEGRKVLDKTFDSPEAAAVCYDKKAIEVFGKFAKLNFDNIRAAVASGELTEEQGKEVLDSLLDVVIHLPYKQ